MSFDGQKVTSSLILDLDNHDLKKNNIGWLHLYFIIVIWYRNKVDQARTFHKLDWHLHTRILVPLRQDGEIWNDCQLKIFQRILLPWKKEQNIKNSCKLENSMIKPINSKNSKINSMIIKPQLLVFISIQIFGVNAVFIRSKEEAGRGLKGSGGE